MAINKPAPRIDTTRPADFSSSFSDISALSADTTGDLTALTKRPKHAAGLLRLNNSTAAALTAVLMPEMYEGSTETMSVVVNAASQYEVPIPIKKIVGASSGALTAIAYWWCDDSSSINK
jgi:hypothetical protein